jgi:hypothetical protein
MAEMVVEVMAERWALCAAFFLDNGELESFNLHLHD